MEDKSPSRTVQAVKTSCSILEALQELDGAGVTELATHLNLAKSSVHAHLATLEQNEIVVADDDRYRLSFRFLEFGEYVKEQSTLYHNAKEEIEKLQAETGELAHLAIEEHGRAVFIIREHGPDAVHIAASRTGNREWLHCTSVGKGMLAHLPGERVEHIIERWGLPRMTDRTITDIDALFEELKQVRERGFAIDDQERIDGFRGVAVPLFDREHTVLGAISVSGPVSRFRGTRLREELPEALSDTANIIEIKQSYS